MQKKNIQSYLAIRRERLEKLCSDYRHIIREAIQAHGSSTALSRALGKHDDFVRECLRGGVAKLKHCAEEVARIGVKDEL